MRNDKFILDAKGNPAPCPDLLEWGRWMQDFKHVRQVGDETFNGVRVSTVFLGLDHSFGEGPPVLWETMIFGGPEELDQTMQRCAGSREQAEAMHARMVERVKAFRHQVP